MDTITHTLFGLTTYGAVNKSNLSKREKAAIGFTAIVGSNIPDIDVVMRVTEIGRIMDLMWHRGITHSLLMIPIWTFLLYCISAYFFKVKSKKITLIALFTVSLHVLADVLNTWGTGIFEPFSSVRISFGVLSIIDFVIWGMMLIGLIVTLLKKSMKSHRVYKFVWIGIAIHIFFQCIQGYVIYQSSYNSYDKTVLKADFTPWHFTVIGQKENVFELSSATVFSERQLQQTLISANDADLSELHQSNPKAQVLIDWAPFVIIVDNEEELGVYDPRFYMNGESFLYESIAK
jgi:inner membrane protein